MDKTRNARIGLFLLLAATLALIWGNSLQGPAASSALSSGSLKIFTPFLEIFVGRGNVTEYLVRKLAHFTEFAILGSELALLLIVYRKVSLQGVVNCLFASLSAAVIDETLQIFSGRGPMVQDVVLDFAGATAGILFVAALHWLFAALGQNTRRRN